jgi:hypothetical protein
MPSAGQALPSLGLSQCVQSILHIPSSKESDLPIKVRANPLWDSASLRQVSSCAKAIGQPAVAHHMGGQTCQVWLFPP